MKYSVLDLNAKVIEDKSLDAVSINENFNAQHVNYLIDTYQKKSLRQGSASTKNRSEVSGGGAKPYKQKGTGNARRGSNRTPLRPGGGVVFGPRPRDFNSKLNTKLFQSSLVSILKQRKDEISIIDFGTDRLVKTKEVKTFLKNAGVSSQEKAFFILDLEEDGVIEKATRNLTNVYLSSAYFLPITQLLASKKIFISNKAFQKIQEKVSQ